MPETVSVASLIYIHARLKAYAGVLIHRCDWNITHVKSTGSTTVRRPVSIKMKLKEMGLALLPGTLLPGSRYEFDLRVVYGSPGNSLTATAATVVRQTKTSLPVAVFAGGSKRTVSVSEGATIDASGSYDPARVKDSLKLFEWRCFRRATVSAGAWVTINCTGLLGSGVHSPLRVISPGAMSAGTQYRFKITFSVRTPSYGLFREGSAVTIIEAVSDPTPTCAIELAGAVTNAGTLFSPYGRKVKLLAAARPHPKSPTPKNMLRYGWTVAVTGSASGSAGLSLADSATDRPSFVLPWSSDIVPGATYAFKVTVTDPGFEFPVASTAVIDVRVGIAPNASVAVIPASGVAYDTVFQIQIAGAGESPLLYKFAYRQEPTSRVVYLEADSYDRVLNTTLPSADALTVLVGVRDALGSVAEATATVSVSEMARTAGSERVCSAARHAADSIRRILQETSAGGLGLCTLVELAVRSSVETGEYPRALRQISGIQTILDKMLRNVSQSGAGGNATDLTACTDPHANLGAPSGCATGGLGTLTPTTLTSALWDILFAELARVNEQDQALTGQVGLQSMGAAVELTSSPAANNSRQALESIANTTGRIIDSISTEDLTTGDAGKDAVQVISRIVQLAVENSNSSAATTVSGGGGSGAPGPSPGPSPGTGPGPSPSPRPGTSSTASEFCGALESAVGLTTTLMFRVGSSLIPGEAPLAYEGSVLGASATAVFADASAKLNVSGGAGSGANPATIELPPVLQIDGALKRPTALVATSAWKSLGSCRAGSVAAVDNGVVSVTVRANSSTAETHTFTDAGAMLLEFPSGAAGSDAGESVATVASCEFWSVAADDWSPEGCTTSITSEGGVACQCTHLTEFAVVRRQRRSASDGGAAVPVFAQRMYAAFTGVFALVCVGAAAQSVMIGRVRLGLFWRISICVMLAAACRVAGCVVLGQLNGQGEDPSSAVAYVISCGPYLFSYAVVLQHLLLLGTLLDRNAAGQKAEARAIAFRRATALATPALLLLVAGIFALGVFGGAAGLQGAYRAAATAVALMSFTFAAAFAHVYLRLRAVVKESQSHRSGGKVSVIGQYEAGTTPWRIAGGVAFAAQSVLMAASAYAVGADDETVYGMTGVYMAWDAALFVCTLALHRPSFMPKGATGSKRGGASSRGSRASTRSRGSVQSRVSLAEYGSRGRSSNSAGRGSKGLASQTPRSRRSAGPMTKRMQMLEQHRAAIAESQQRVSVQSMARFASDSQAVLAQSSSGIEMTGAEGKLALVGSRRSVAASSADDSAAWSPNSSRGEGRRPARRAKIDQYLSPSGGVGPAFVQDARDSLSRNSVSQLSQKSRGGDDSILHIKSDENNMTQSWYSRSRMRVAI